MLQSDPIGFVLYLFYLLVTVLLSLILHEVAHGYVAYRCGDATAKWMGRLSLDPRKHLDPIGTICMFLFGIGWAKPVPVTNLSLFVLCTALAVGVNAVMFKPEFLQEFKSYFGTLEYVISPYYVYGNSIASGNVTEELLAAMAHPWLQYVQRFLLNMATINLSLAVFNFLPIPPLDGYHIFNDLPGKVSAFGPGVPRGAGGFAAAVLFGSAFRAAIFHEHPCVQCGNAFVSDDDRRCLSHGDDVLSEGL